MRKLLSEVFLTLPLLFMCDSQRKQEMNLVGLKNLKDLKKNDEKM